MLHILHNISCIVLRVAYLISLGTQNFEILIMLAFGAERTTMFCFLGIFHMYALLMQGSFTGPRIFWSGSSLRPEATGYGLVISIFNSHSLDVWWDVKIWVIMYEMCSCSMVAFHFLSFSVWDILSQQVLSISCVYPCSTKKKEQSLSIIAYDLISANSSYQNNKHVACKSILAKKIITKCSLHLFFQVIKFLTSLSCFCRFSLPSSCLLTWIKNLKD